VIFELAGKPMINRVVRTANKINSDLIAIVVGYKKDKVIGVVPKKDNIKFIEQVEQNGTGHAVMVTQDIFRDFDGDVFILCGDVPLLRYKTLEKIQQQHREENASCTVLTAFMNDALKYGRIVRNSDGNVQRIVEFKDATEAEKEIKEINTGIYCFDAKDLFEALQNIDNNNNQNEYYLTDTLEILNDKDKLVTSVILDDMVEASGVNSKEQLADLENEFLSRQNHFEG
jgi:UDP-N-acetylglucosamine diphosphorylase/glucosamine-1-phosphate N-acetyltransferase